MNLNERNIYLHDVALSEALASWHAALDAAGALATLPAETVPLAAALGRVTAAPVWAKISSPHYHAAAMDGYAVRLATCSISTPCTLAGVQLNLSLNFSSNT